jgi:ribosome-interacting GTPase 1
MPTNLPPEYFAAEKVYKAAQSSAEKIDALEEMISAIPKHKGTDKLRADFRRRLSKLKNAAQSKKGVSKHESAYQLDKEGAGQVAVIGAANVGKSALVAALTNATPQVADFPHTTWEPTPGMMPIDNIQVQLIDTPPLDGDYVEPELFDLIKRADLVLLLVDVQTDPIQQLEDTVESLEEHRIMPRHRQNLVDNPEKWAIIPFLVLANKTDDEICDEDFEIFCELLEEEWPLLPISVATERNFDQLKATVFQKLKIIRVYSKAPNQDPDFSTPFVLQKGDTIDDFAAKVHKDFVEQLKFAKVWGQDVFDGQMVKRDHVLHDGDVVELHI